MNDYKLINGVDIVDINRIAAILDKNRDGFLGKVFTEKEIEYIEKKGFKANTIAGMFASKEAISKALGTGIGPIGWKDMQVLHTDRGKPYVDLRDEIKDEYNILSLELSISHERVYAIAFVIGQRLNI